MLHADNDARITTHRREPCTVHAINNGRIVSLIACGFHGDPPAMRVTWSDSAANGSRDKSSRTMDVEMHSGLSRFRDATGESAVRKSHIKALVPDSSDTNDIHSLRTIIA